MSPPVLTMASSRVILNQIEMYVHSDMRIAWSDNKMKRIQTIDTRDLNKSAVTGGCGECQTSCQSACKTSCGVANQKCENQNK